MFDFGFLLSLGTVGPLKAFFDSDLCGQFIVIAQLAMSAFSWSLMWQKGSQLSNVNKQTKAFTDAFIKREDPIDLFIETERADLEASEIGKIYYHTCRRLTDYISPEQRRALRVDPNYPLRMTHRQMDLIESNCAHQLEDTCVKLGGIMMTLIAICTSVAPLLGLFGTVWGVMLAFQAMASSGSADIAQLAPGISSALLTTVVGLFVAIPSTIGYNILQTRLESVTVNLEGFSEDLMGKLRLCYLEER